MSEQGPHRGAASPLEPDRRLRLFVGIEPSPAWQESLTRVSTRARRRLGEGYRWVRPELFHVTVVFLGGHPRSSVERLLEALDGAADGATPFPLRLGSMRGTGRQGQGPLVVLVADPTGRLAEVRRRLEQALDTLAIDFDRKPLRPHITVARPRRPGRLMSAPVVDVPSVDGRRSAMLVQELLLFQSDLGPGGPRYSVLGRLRIGGGPTRASRADDDVFLDEADREGPTRRI